MSRSSDATASGPHEPRAAGPIRIVIVDDTDVIRLLLRTYLEQSGGYMVVAEGSSGADAVSLTRTHQPDLLLLDVTMPVMGGLEAIPLVKDVSPRTCVMMFTGFDDDRLEAEARRLGASGCILKGTAPRMVANRLAAAHGGHTVM